MKHEVGMSSGPRSHVKADIRNPSTGGRQENPQGDFRSAILPYAMAKNKTPCLK